MIKKVLVPLFSFLIIFLLGVSMVMANQHGGTTPTGPGGTTPTGPGGTTPTGPGGTTPTGPSTSGNSFKLDNPFSVGNTLFQLLETVVNRIVLPIGGMLAVLSFIYAGFLYVTAQGKPAALEKANKALLYTAIGTAVLLGSWVLAGVIRTTINQLIT